MASRGHNPGSSGARPLVFVGRLGAFIPGVPARNLSAEEAQKYQQAIDNAQRFGRTLYVLAEPLPEPEEEQDGESIWNMEEQPSSVPDPSD